MDSRTHALPLDCDGEVEIERNADCYTLQGCGSVLLLRIDSISSAWRLRQTLRATLSELAEQALRRGNLHVHILVNGFVVARYQPDGKPSMLSGILGFPFTTVHPSAMLRAAFYKTT